MKNMRYYLILGITLFLSINLFTKIMAQDNPKKSYENFLAGKAIIIDVREEDEIKDGMIKGAFWFPLSKIQVNQSKEITKIQELAKGKEIYLYCRSGNRSGKVKNYLHKSGVKAFNLGGYPSLVDKMIPIQTGQK